MGNGMPAKCARMYSSGRCISSKHFRMSAEPPVRGMSWRVLCSMIIAVDYHASDAPTPGTPANISLVAQVAIQGSKSCSLVDAHSRYALAVMSSDRLASGSSALSSSFSRYDDLALSIPCGHGAPLSIVL